MSQHPSLRTSKAGRKHRSVLKRYEKFFALKEKGSLKDGSSVFGLPKLKIVRVKVKKEKAEEKPEELEAAATETGAVAQKEVPKKEASKETAPKPEKKEKKK